MDLEFFNTLSAKGCEMLNTAYAVEKAALNGSLEQNEPAVLYKIQQVIVALDSFMDELYNVQVITADYRLVYDD